MSKSFLSFFLSAHMAQCLCILFAMLHNFLSTFLLVPWQNIFLPFFLSHSCQSAILYIHVPECLHSCLSTYFSSCLHGCLYLYPRSHSFLSSFLLFLGLSVVCLSTCRTTGAPVLSSCLPIYVAACLSADLNVPTWLQVRLYRHIYIVWYRLDCLPVRMTVCLSVFRLFFPA
jgi:hypothetical protein